jgi:predicted GIY-YIG superfamily endonuclease
MRIIGGSVKSTKARRPMDLIYFRSVDSRSEAMLLEKDIKNYKDTEKYLNNICKNMAPSSNG